MNHARAEGDSLLQRATGRIPGRKAARKRDTSQTPGTKITTATVEADSPLKSLDIGVKAPLSGSCRGRVERRSVTPRWFGLLEW